MSKKSIQNQGIPRAVRSFQPDRMPNRGTAVWESLTPNPQSLLPVPAERRRLARHPIFWCGVILVLLLISVPASSQEILRLSVEQAVDLALEKSLDLRSARLDTRIRTVGIAAEKARFGRSLTGSFSHESERSPSISTLEAVRNTAANAQSFTLGAFQRLSTGGRIGVDFSNYRSSSNVAFRTIDPVYGSSLQLSFIQPLLQGRGAINRIGLDLARNDLENARVDLDDRIRSLRAEVGLAYWDLFLARADLDVKQQLHAGALRVLETVRARAEMGTGTRNSILEAEVGVARREEEIVVAQGALDAAEDRLKSRIGLDQDPAAWSVHLALVDTPAVHSFDADLGEGLEKALAVSAAFQQTLLLLQDLDLQIALARDQTRPSVDLTARAGLTGLGADYADDMQGLGKADGRTWAGSVDLTFPLGSTAEKARYQQRILEKKRRGVDLDDLRLRIAQQIRDRHRQVRISLQRTEAARASVRLATQHVDDQEARLSLGLSTVRQVLDAQDDLASARASLLQAVVDYSRALILWNQLTGE